MAFGPPAITYPTPCEGPGSAVLSCEGWGGGAGGAAVRAVPFLQNSSVKRGSPLCVMSLKLNLLFGFGSPSLGFCDLRCVKQFSVFRKNTEEVVVLWAVRKPLEDALEDAVEDVGCLVILGEVNRGPKLSEQAGHGGCWLICYSLLWPLFHFLEVYQSFT